MATTTKSLAKTPPVRKAASPAPRKIAAAPPKVMAPASVAAKAVAVPAKVKKPKLVRDSFTIPKPEYAVLDELKQRAAKLAVPAKKSELLRAGIKALAAMPDGAFLIALRAVPAIKTGRPSSS